MAALNESQIRAQAITLFEEKYSYSVIGNKLGRSKSWISKWAKRYKQSQNETLRNRYHGGRKSVLTAAAQELIKQSKYRRGQSLRKLERRLKDKRLAGSKETIRHYMRTTLKWKSFKRQKAWTSVPLTTLKNLIGSMPNRLEAVIKSKGNIIKY